jgi:hypothetical protein
VIDTRAGKPWSDAAAALRSAHLSPYVQAVGLSIVSIANILENAVHFPIADWDHADIDYRTRISPMSINMSILLTLIVSFSIALAGVGHF